MGLEYVSDSSIHPGYQRHHLERPRAVSVGLRILARYCYVHELKVGHDTVEGIRRLENMCCYAAPSPMLHPQLPFYVERWLYLCSQGGMLLKVLASEIYIQNNEWFIPRSSNMNRENPRKSAVVG